MRNKKHLPESISQPLCEAFGRQPSQRSSPCLTRENALERLRSVTLKDMQIPEYLRNSIPLYRENGDLFWNGELSSFTKHESRNVLGVLYHSNKRRTSADNVRRALYSMTLYKVIQGIMKLHASKTFTTRIAKHCAKIILQDDSNMHESLEAIIEELKADYKVGCIYEPYARRAGNGIIFYLFALPSHL